MREYDETTLKIAERVLKRSDEIIRQRQEQADKSDKSDKEQNITYDASVVEQGQSKTPKVRHLYAALAFCAGIVLCLGLMKFIEYTNELIPGDNDQNEVSETTSETEDTTTSATIVNEAVIVNDTSAVSSEVSVTEPVSDTLTALPSSESASEAKTVNADKDKPSVTQKSVADVHVNDNKEKPENTVAEAKVVTSKPEVTTQKPEVTTQEPETEAVTIPVTTVKPVLQPTMCGDVNGDNIIDIEDAVLVRNYVNYFEGTSWVEFYKKQKDVDPKFAEQALANADAYRPSDNREITSEDAEAIMGYINGEYLIPTNDL